MKEQYFHIYWLKGISVAKDGAPKSHRVSTDSLGADFRQSLFNTVPGGAKIFEPAELPMHEI